MQKDESIQLNSIFIVMNLKYFTTLAVIIAYLKLLLTVIKIDFKKTFI